MGTIDSAFVGSGFFGVIFEVALALESDHRWKGMRFVK